MVWVYILQSQTTGRFYTGITDRLHAREGEHSSGQTISTRGGGPWKLVYSEACENRSLAAKREHQIKSWKSQRSIQELIDSSG